jgi:hypothetical protein
MTTDKTFTFDTAAFAAAIDNKRIAAEEARAAQEASKQAGYKMFEFADALNAEFDRRVLAELGAKDWDELSPTFIVELETGRYSSKRTKKFTARFEVKGDTRLISTGGRFGDYQNFRIITEHSVWGGMVDKSDRSLPTHYGFQSQPYREKFCHHERIQKALRKVAREMIREFKLDTIKTYG